MIDIKGDKKLEHDQETDFSVDPAGVHTLWRNKNSLMKPVPTKCCSCSNKTGAMKIRSDGIKEYDQGRGKVASTLIVIRAEQPTS